MDRATFKNPPKKNEAHINCVSKRTGKAILMTSNIESELKAQVAEFAKSDEALKELIARLAELEGIIDSNQKSRDSLDKSTTSINQLASNLGSFLTLSVDSVGNISKVSTDIGATIQRIEAEISSAVASNLAEATKEIRDAVSNIDAVAKVLAQDVDSIEKSQISLSTKVNESMESLNEKVDEGVDSLNQRIYEVKVLITQQVPIYAKITWMVTGLSTIIIGVLIFVT